MVTGTVTVQPGRILGDRTLVMQDESGGIAVRLPGGEPVASLPRGTIVQVGGSLADPYGNLELRPERESDISVIGNGGLPEPLVLDSARVVESAEGLLATLSATLVDIDRYSSGAVSLTVRDDRGDVRVYAFGPVGLDPSSLTRGQRLKVTGVVGQRASRAGAPDGYRIWLRGPADLVVLNTGPTATPPPAGGGADPREGKPPRVPIEDATPGRWVTIVGVVTSKAGVIDSEGRRVTVQDRSGAILVRYPVGVRPAGVGQVIRASGEVGTWYDAVQLEAESAPRTRGRGRVVPSLLRRLPAAADEWRLVTVAVRITDVERDGDTWRAEAELTAGGSLPVVGLAGSRIDSEPLEPGRTVRVTGLVRRAHPAASDQRFAIAPRSRKDLEFGPPVTDGASAADADQLDAASIDGRRLPSVADDGGVVTTATLGALEDFADQLVRVGGRVKALDGRRLTLDDGTASGTVRLGGAIEPRELALHVGEVVNAIGRVQARRTGPEVVVASAADVRRAARPVAASLEAPLVDARWLVGAGGPTDPIRDARVADAPAAPAPRALDVRPLLVIGGLATAALLLLSAAAVVAWRSRGAVSPAPVGSRLSRGR